MAIPKVLAPDGVRSTSKRSAVTGFGVEFRPFLHTQLWEENNGMRLSILSALARLDLDPWDEAAALAQLPRETASRRLSERLQGLPGAPASPIAYAPVYHRALDLLPVSSVASPADAGGALTDTGSRAKRRLTIELIFFAAMLASIVMTVAQASHTRAAPALAAPPAAAAPQSSARAI